MLDAYLGSESLAETCYIPPLSNPPPTSPDPTTILTGSLFGAHLPASSGPDTEELLRVLSTVAARNSSFSSSLACLQLPPALLTLALDSRRPDVLEATALGEELLAGAVYEHLQYYDSAARSRIVESYREVFTSSWMLGTYAQHCHITGPKLSPPIHRRDELVAANFRPLANVINAMIGMSYIAAGQSMGNVNEWIRHVILPWAIDTTAYLRRVSSSQVYPTCVPLLLRHPRLREATHLQRKSPLRDELIPCIELNQRTTMDIDTNDALNLLSLSFVRKNPLSHYDYIPTNEVVTMSEKIDLTKLASSTKRKRSSANLTRPASVENLARKSRKLIDGSMQTMVRTTPGTENNSIRKESNTIIPFPASSLSASSHLHNNKIIALTKSLTPRLADSTNTTLISYACPRASAVVKSIPLDTQPSYNNNPGTHPPSKMSPSPVMLSTTPSFEIPSDSAEPPPTRSAPCLNRIHRKRCGPECPFGLGLQILPTANGAILEPVFPQVCRGSKRKAAKCNPGSFGRHEKRDQLKRSLLVAVQIHLAFKQLRIQPFF